MKKRLPHLDPKPIKGAELGYTNRFHFLQHGSLKPLTGVTHKGKLVTHNGEIVKHQPMKENKVAELTDILLSGDITKIRNTMKFIPDYSVGDFSEKEDVVSVGGWLMSANKDTTESAEPITQGEPIDSIDHGAIFATVSVPNAVKSYHAYTMTKTGFLSELFIKVPNWTLNTITRVEIRIGEKYDVIDNPVLGSSGEWISLTRTNKIIQAGQLVEITLSTYTSNAALAIDGPWLSNVGTGIPLTGEFEASNNNLDGTIRISHTDLDSADRTTELRAVQVGSNITIAETSDPTRNSIFRTTSIDLTPTEAYSTFEYEFIDDGSKGPFRDGQITGVTIRVPQTVNTEYSVNTALPAPEFATFESALLYDGIDQAAPLSDVYGVSIRFQEASVPDDWDYVLHTEEASAIGVSPTVFSEPVGLFTGDVKLPGNKFLHIVNGVIVGVS